MRGRFHNLTQYVGLGFDPSNSAAASTIGETGADSIFVWPSEMVEQLNKDEWRGIAMGQKKLNMVSYLWEMFYNLALDPVNDVSQAPGVEIYLKEFNDTEDD